MQSPSGTVPMRHGGRVMSEDLRRLVHLDGPLPADTECELVCVPTFHRPLGFRIGHGVVEVWAADDVTRCPCATDRVVSAAAASAAAPIEAPTALGRDGLVVYLRVGSLDVERHTSDQPPDDPVLRFAEEFLRSISQIPPEAWARDGIAALRSDLTAWAPG